MALQPQPATRLPAPRGSRFWAMLAAALGAGGLFACTAPPTSFTPAVLFGLAAIAALFELACVGRLATPKARRPATWLLGWLFGCGANLVALGFIPKVITNFTDLGPWLAALALLLAAAAQGLPYALAGALYSWLRRLRIPAPIAFGIGIYVGHFVPAVFLWTPAGGITGWVWTIQTAEVWGERGVSLVLCIWIALVVDALRASLERPRETAERPRQTAWKRVGLAALLPIALLAYGKLRIAQVQAQREVAPKVRLGIVNPATDAKLRWETAAAPSILSNLQTLTAAAEAGGAELTLWPEAAYPYAFAHINRTGPRGRESILGTAVHGPVLFGAVLVRGRGDSTNSALLLNKANELSESSDKQFLLPFGEHIPFAEEFPILRRAFARGSGLVAGSATHFQEFGAARISVLNCLEDTRTDASYQLGHRDSAGAAQYPNLLVNLTNDAWFAGTFESELHTRLATLRAVEQRRDLARSVNTGRGGLVWATGAIAAPAMSAAASAQVAEAALLEPSTLFARYGDAPLAWLLLATVVAAVLHARRAAATAQTPLNAGKS